MNAMFQTKTLDASDLSILAYAQHMADTARSDAAKNLFESFVQQEIQRLKASGGLCFSVVGKPQSKSDRRIEGECR